uniref:Putative LAGLIDADG homing endonuclease n=1 Tax=Symbiochloris reticulata TaxID=40981 RepID=A0A1B0RYA6_9CHLO|nr:putative LAGLIDADG homing endonuclease [Symbiochloris reticulata]
MLTQEQDEIIIGAMLGDASAEYNSSACRIRFDHSIKQEDYVRWLAKKLEPYSGLVTSYGDPDKRTNKTYSKIRFYTKTNDIFTKYRNMFYTDPTRGPKDTVPNNIKDLISKKLTLVVWYLDDGSKRTYSNAYRLHVECFPSSVVNQLRCALRTHYGIESKPHSHKNISTESVEKELIDPENEKGFIIHIGSRYDNAKKLNAAIKDYVALEIPSMLFKFF